MGVAEKDAVLGLAGDGYFFNKEVQECQGCQAWLIQNLVENQLAKTWAADVELPSARSSFA